jgi:hypothetical protein
MIEARSAFTATLLGDGTVLVAGGNRDHVIVSSAERYDPSSGEWESMGSMSARRTGHTATLLPDGTVLVAGGEGNAAPPQASAERFIPRSGTWTAAGDMLSPRTAHTSTPLLDGRVLVAGASPGMGGIPLASAEACNLKSGN